MDVLLTALGLASMLVSAGSSGNADLRCGGRLVTRGMTTIELRAFCGEPDLKEARTVIRSGFAGRLRGSPDLLAGAVSSREVVEDWTYVGDGRQFPRLVTVRRGQIDAIRLLSKISLAKDPGCGRKTHPRGTRTAVVRLSCGEPDERAVWEDEIEFRRGAIVARQLVVRERWTFNPGKGRFLRILHFANGRLTDTEVGPRAP